MRRVVLLALLLALAALGAPVARAAPNYCADTADNIVVYVDKTTPYDDTDKTALVDGVSRLFESLGGGERFTMRTIAQSSTASVSLMDACVPYCPPAGLFGDLFSDCTEGMMLNDRKHVRDLVVGQLRALLADFVELPNSEIIRTIALSASSEQRIGQPLRLYLFTDLIENSVYLPGKQFFSDSNDKLLVRIEADGLVPDFAGATVRVFGVGRGGTAERRPLDQALLTKLMDFWQRYFAAAGATVTIQQSLGAV
jgi:hypothetical protein